MNNHIELSLEVQRIVIIPEIPTNNDITHWIITALKTQLNQQYKQKYQAELTIRIVDEIESAALNHTYRHKSGPTNVLSFPYDVVLPEQNYLLGDLVICAPLVAKEAVDQGKTISAHWAHLVVHGVLHLLGYDHHTDEHACIMENLEKEILHILGFPDPYLEPEVLLS